MTKVALVTGSTSGIGLCIAEALASRGISVIVTGFGGDKEIDEILQKLRRNKIRADYLFSDLADVDGLEVFWQEVTRLYPDGVDILVNCAGIQKRMLVEDLPIEDWNIIISVMLTAPFQLIKLCLPAMKKKGWGRIINISSIRGIRGGAFTSAYCAAKHGIVGLTKAVALETAQSGVTCNAVCPGYVDTPLGALLPNAVAKEKGISVSRAEEVILDWVPTKTKIQPSQVAALVTFLCSDDASQMTGTSVTMDGGMTAQ